MSLLDDESDYGFWASPKMNSQRLLNAEKRLQLRKLLGAQSAQSQLLGGPDPNSGVPDVSWSPVPQRAPTSVQVPAYGPDGAATYSRVANTPRGLLDAGVPADQVTPDGLLGHTPEDAASRQSGLLNQVDPEYGLAMARIAPAMKNMTPAQQLAFQVSPQDASRKSAEAAFTVPPQVALARAVAGLPEGDPTKKTLQAILEKEGYIKEKDPLYVRATEADIARDNAATAKDEAAAAQINNGSLPDEVINGMAQQYLAGDKSVFQNLGRGTQGSTNIARLRTAIEKVGTEMGMSPADRAGKIAQFSADTAGLRTAAQAGAKMDTLATEVEKFADLALDASNNLPRGSFVPLTKAEQMFQSGTSSPELASFIAANTSLVNAYSAVAGRGTPTVSGQEHAYKMLSTAMSPEAYAAVVKQLRAETAAAKESPNVTIEDIRKRMAAKEGGGVTMPAKANPSASNPPKAPAAPPKLSNDSAGEAAYKALPPGATYIDPTGQYRVKGAGNG